LAAGNSASARSRVAAPNEAYFAHSVGEPRWDDPEDASHLNESEDAPQLDGLEDAFRLRASAGAFPMSGFEVGCS
jgi:hypothetical protein